MTRGGFLLGGRPASTIKARARHAPATPRHNKYNIARVCTFARFIYAYHHPVVAVLLRVRRRNILLRFLSFPRPRPLRRVRVRRADVPVHCTHHCRPLNNRRR